MEASVRPARAPNSACVNSNCPRRAFIFAPSIACVSFVICLLSCRLPEVYRKIWVSSGPAAQLVEFLCTLRYLYIRNNTANVVESKHEQREPADMASGHSSHPPGSRTIAGIHSPRDMDDPIC